MPLKVRLKLIAIIAAGGALNLWLWATAWWLGALTLIAAIIYIEMIYPKWNFFGRSILNVKKSGEKAVAITFDDGPSVWTSRILDALKEENVKATFFLLGINIRRHPQIAKRIQDEGHVIGLHGETHTKFHFKSRAFIQQDLDAAVESFKSAGLAIPKLIRFPHGFKNIFAVCEIKCRGLTLCGWGKGVWDSKRPGVDLIVERSLKLKAGEILLLHDGDGAKENPDRSQTAAALPQILRGLKERGFLWVGLDSQNS